MLMFPGTNHSRRHTGVNNLRSGFCLVKCHLLPGNMRAPSKLLCVQWLKEAWDSLSEGLIKNSFLACGISVPIGGSQDSQIHCSRMMVLPLLQEPGLKTVQGSF